LGSVNRIRARSRGFIYEEGVMGVTTERAELATCATVVARRLRFIDGAEPEEASRFVDELRSGIDSVRGS
jgi:hypothetical protein